MSNFSLLPLKPGSWKPIQLHLVLGSFQTSHGFPAPHGCAQILETLLVVPKNHHCPSLLFCQHLARASQH